MQRLGQWYDGSGYIHTYAAIIELPWDKDNYEIRNDPVSASQRTKPNANVAAWYTKYPDFISKSFVHHHGDKLTDSELKSV